jgi:2-dehydro-3-deoxygluconokinase
MLYSPKRHKEQRNESLEIKTRRQSLGLVSLGEVMLRLDPGEGRVHTTRSFQVWEGGGEYNVARGLKRCFGMDAAIGHCAC